MTLDPKANPYQIQDLYYGQIKENPSYNSEMPRDFPYDPGATTSIFELGYVPTSTSVIPLILIALITAVSLWWIIRHNINLRSVLHTTLTVALCAVLLGPLVVPSVLPVRTTIGVGKLIALSALMFSFAATFLRTKRIPLPSAGTILPIMVYLTSLFLSLPVATNPDFFVSDLKVIFGGILFYFAAYTLFEWKSVLSTITSISLTLIPPSLLILLVAFFQDSGKTLMSTLYPQYENIVFTFDLSRGRILSIVDMEFFLPLLLYLLVYEIRWKKVAATVMGVVSFAVFLTNYRYRFLSYLAGLLGYIVLIPKQARRHIIKTGATLFVGMFTIYVVFSAATGRITLINRFLLQNYANDVDSLERRLIMAQQALNLFSQFPVFGVGLGNYKDNVQVTYTSFGGRFYEPFFKILENVYAYPHNWFLLVLAENGIVGLAVLLYLLYTFAKTDMRLYRRLQGKGRARFIAVSLVTWLYVFANQFTPLHTSESMVIFFWAFRGAIDKLAADRLTTTDA